MAAAVPAASPALSEEEIRSLDGAASGRAYLPTIHLQPCGADGAVLMRAAAYLLRVRAGGFMVAVPDYEEVTALLSGLLEVEVLELASYPCEVELETTRGRRLGASLAFLVDVLWACVGLFCKVLRGQAGAEVMRFKFNDEVGRPRKASILQLADVWICEVMDEGTAEDYITGEDAEQEPVAESAALDPSAELMQLRQKVAEMESRQALRNFKLRPKLLQDLWDCWGRQEQPAPAWMLLHGNACES